MSILFSPMKRKPRVKPIFVRATEQEHRAFNDLAVQRHTNLSELIRQLLHREVAAQSQGQAA